MERVSIAPKLSALVFRSNRASSFLVQPGEQLRGPAGHVVSQWGASGAKTALIRRKERLSLVSHHEIGEAAPRLTELAWSIKARS